MQSLPGPTPGPAGSRRGPAGPLTAAAADVLRILHDTGAPVFLTVHADGRRRYRYWQSFDPRTGRGSCYVALPTAECEALLAAGRITLGEPVVDPARTTYRVRPVRKPAASARTVRPRSPRAPRSSRTAA
ncbi:hypothetical protein GCM10009535_16090 [Streptomyces thermocarboxydovorans]|uniref:Uncharacterized protein n=1 Tax=Streptomyces thermocarboxydovorans TaxID=59298 RepID=A0ABP3SI57_9ACTN